MSGRAEITELVTQVAQGDKRSAERLLPIVYDELHGLAQALMRKERANHTLQATALVSEAYLRLVDQTRADWRSESHFRAIAAQMMNRVLVDYARSNKRLKRGGNRQRVTLSGQWTAGQADVDLIDLMDLLERLRQLDEQQYRIAQLRLLGGLDQKQTAEVLNLPLRTSQREWQMAKAWLQMQLRGEP